MTVNETAGWHHQLNGHEFEQTPGEGERRKPVVLQFMGSQRVRHDSATEQQQQYMSVYTHTHTYIVVVVHVCVCVYIYIHTYTHIYYIKL